MCSKYNPNPGAYNNRGSKCHIWETFKNIWGECPNWPIIPNQTDWIDNNYETRKDIAHGIASIDINVVENVFAKIETIKRVAHRLITDWKENKLAPNITDEIQAKLL